MTLFSIIMSKNILCAVILDLDCIESLFYDRSKRFPIVQWAGQDSVKQYTYDYALCCTVQGTELRSSGT